MENPEEQIYYEFESDADSDDSQDDPTFDVLEETFSNLSIKRKTKSRIVKGTDEEEEEESDVVEMVVIPKLDEKDQKSYETIEKIIEGGQVEKLKVDQCKIYLRKYGLRLSGNKETLIQRIKEHIEIVKGDGEKKYPVSSFVWNCKGDACTGDIVMFEQNVYEMFSIVSRSASGPPCGTRVVAGRIVKESYGAAKQQHTFTIEVLWSRGEKPLPPLHPLLIKGRNLYRLKTMRQKWEDEGERHRILSEKHARGGVARLTREARIQQKEMRKTQKPTRTTKTEHLNVKQPMKPDKLINQPIQQQIKNATKEEQDSQQNLHGSIYPENLHGTKPDIISNPHVPAEKLHERQPLTRVNCSSRSYTSNSNHLYSHFQMHNSKENRERSPLRSNYVQGQQSNNVNFNGSRIYSQQNDGYYRHGNMNAARNPPVQEQGRVKVQICRYYAQGRCHFGDRCKYLHDN